MHIRRKNVCLSKEIFCIELLIPVYCRLLKWVSLFYGFC